MVPSNFIMNTPSSDPGVCWRRASLESLSVGPFLAWMSCLSLGASSCLWLADCVVGKVRAGGWGEKRAALG